VGISVDTAVEIAKESADIILLENDKPERDVTIETPAEDAESLADALGFEEFDVWGSHTGALAAMELRRDLFMYWPWYRVRYAAARRLGIPDAADMHRFSPVPRTMPTRTEIPQEREPNLGLGRPLERSERRYCQFEGLECDRC